MRPFALGLAAALTALLAACSGGGLAPGLTARMDQAGARLDRQAALMIVNHYRQTRGAAPLAGDADLDRAAETLAAQYASSGVAPKMPEGVAVMRVSAGYANFAETFSGWRGRAEDADALAASGTARAGIGVAYEANSAYGVHWVLLLAEDGAP